MAPAFLAAEKQKLVGQGRGTEGRRRAGRQGDRSRRESRQGLPGRRRLRPRRPGPPRRRVGARAAPVKAHAEAFAVGGKTPEEIEKNRSIAKKNFLALIACLMVGTAALPHILMRYYTTPSVQEARVSVFWALFFIFLLYFTAPALAILAKYEVYSNLVGSSFASLPAWVSNWATVDKTLMNIADINKDGIVQLAEIVIGGDLIVLATPEIAGLPYVISGLVAAGGLAAALSTADGLLLTIANAHVARPVLQDDRPERLDGAPSGGVQGPAARGGADGRLRHQPEAGRHPVPGRCGLLAGGLGLLPGAGLRRVLEARQLARRGARHERWVWASAPTTCTSPIRSSASMRRQWWDINPISAGTFGIPAGFLGMIIGSLISPAPNKEIQELVDHVRYPNLEGDIDTKGA